MTESDTGGSFTTTCQLLIWMLFATIVNVGLVSMSGEPE